MKSYNAFSHQAKPCYSDVHPINHTRAGVERQRKVAKLFWSSNRLQQTGLIKQSSCHG